MKHLDKETIDGAQQNLAALYQLFPSCFTEAPATGGGKNLRQVVNWGKLRELLGDNVADGIRLRQQQRQNLDTDASTMIKIRRS